MTYEVKSSDEHKGDWIAAAVNDDGDGEMYLVFFSGPDAEQRAREYAAWKNVPGRDPKSSIAQVLNIAARDEETR